MNSLNQHEDIFMEASNLSNSFIIRDNIYPLVEKVLNTEKGAREFTNAISRYINKNSSRLMTSGPVYKLTFTMSDKEEFYNIFNISETDIKKYVTEVTKKANEKANWTLIKNNPIFILFYCVIRYFTIKKNEKAINSALIITALSFYPSMFTKYFEFEPNPGVMEYTIDNLSKKFIIKKEKHIFGTLTYSIKSSWDFHKKAFLIGSDKDCIAFIQRIRNDQNSLIKTIAINYYDNHKKGMTVSTMVDSYDDNVVVDNENNSSRVEAITNKILMGVLVNGVNLELASFASTASKVSKIELRNYLTKIITDNNSETIKSFLESILFLFIYDENRTVEEIRSKSFLAFALSIFKKTNSKNKNINNIKETLDLWGEETGIYAKTARLATRVDYTRGIFLYFVLCIQKYS